MPLAYQETTRWLNYNALGVGVLGNNALSNRPILHIKGQRGGRDNLHPLSRRSRVVQLAYQETTRWLRYNALGVGVLGNSALSNRPILHIRGQRGGCDNLHHCRDALESSNSHIRRQRAGCFMETTNSRLKH